jgi:hypothetical protein
MDGANAEPGFRQSSDALARAPIESVKLASLILLIAALKNPARDQRSPGVFLGIPYTMRPGAD